jgi:hypothetical protein
MTNWGDLKKELQAKKRRYRERFASRGLEVPWQPGDDVEEAIRKAEAARPELTTAYDPFPKTRHVPRLR